MKGSRFAVALPSGGHIRASAFLFVGVVLSACTSQGARIQTSAIERSAPIRDAFVLPPPGGPSIVGIVERRYSNATQQEIALSTRSALPGQNYFRVRLFGPVERDVAGNSSLSDRPLGLTNLASEMRGAFSGVRIQRSPYFVQNRYGPFGYAVGRGTGPDLCLYGWQNLRVPVAIFGNQGNIDVRLRICETGASEEQLLSVMYGYTINAFFAGRPSWSPYGRPPAPAEGLGQPGAEIRPENASGFQTVLTAAPVVVPAAAAPRATGPSTPVLPPPTGPKVPEPPVPAAPAAVIVPPPPANGSGQ